jgi:hypothetical protein
MRIDYDWKDLPNVKRKVSTIADKLLDSVNVLCHFPKNYWEKKEEIAAITDQIRGACEKYGFRVAEVHINGEDNVHHIPILYLLDYLEIPKKIQSSLHLALKEDAWPDFLFIVGLETLEEEVKKRWLRFLKEWVDIQQTNSESFGNKVFFIMVNDLVQNDYSIMEEPELHYEYFNKIFSQVDMKFLVQSNYEGDMNAEYFWSSYVLAELALDDPFLLTTLLAKKNSDGEGVETSLRDYGIQLGWDKQLTAIRNLSQIFWKNDYHKFRSGTIEEFLPYWKEGFICYSAERGIEIHSAALVMINDQERLDRRIWRAQLSLFYNTLDIVRYKISRYLTETYGADWPNRVSLRYEFDFVTTEKGPISEYGHLKRVIDSLYYEKGSKDLAELIEYVEVFWNARNKLAHYTPLNRKEFNTMVHYLEKI